MKRILLTGGNGFIARNLKTQLSNDYDVIAITRKDADLTNSDEVNKFFDGNYFDIVIHTAISGGSRLKDDDDNVKQNNISMFMNIRDNKEHYGRLINIGSGAEIYNPTSPYGLSKYIIRNFVKLESNFYNVRVYAVFGPDELDTRFIKANVVRYINKTPMIIHMNRYIDFFYIDDFAKVIRYYIETPSPPKEFDCCYRRAWDLHHIADTINDCSNYKVGIDFIENGEGDEYIGEFVDLGINYIGLSDGIMETYKKLIK
jgi:nucleoside-diphosphate-sugar epimerase